MPLFSSHYKFHPSQLPLFPWRYSHRANSLIYSSILVCLMIFPFPVDYFPGHPYLTLNMFRMNLAGASLGCPHLSYLDTALGSSLKWFLFLYFISQFVASPPTSSIIYKPQSPLQTVHPISLIPHIQLVTKKCSSYPRNGWQIIPFSRPPMLVKTLVKDKLCIGLPVCSLFSKPHGLWQWFSKSGP